MNEPTIRECHDTGCYFVRFDGGREHPVNLLDEEFPGNGSCLCEDFSCRCSPNFRDNGGHFVPYWRVVAGKKRRAELNPLRTQCKHLDAARDALWPKILKEMLKERKNHV